MPWRHFEMIQARLGILGETPTRFRKGAMIVGEQTLAAALGLLKGRRVTHVSHEGFEGRPGLRWHFLL
jgi:hypothetical protein